MRKVFRIFGVIALAAGIIFSMAACNTDGDDGGVTELKFTNVQVYTTSDGFSFTPFTGSMAVTSDVGGSGSISNGRLSFTIGEPSRLTGGAGAFPADWGVSVSPSNAQAVRLVLNNNMLGNIDGAMTSATSGWQQSVHFYYVDIDCTVTVGARAGIRTETTLRLNQGWNAIISRSESAATAAGYTEVFSVGGLSSGRWAVFPE